MRVVAMKGHLIRLADGRAAVCVGGEDEMEEEEAYLCLIADLPQDADEEVRCARGEISKALGREATAKRGREQAERERAAMLKAVKRASSMLPRESAQEVRAVYKEAMTDVQEAQVPTEN